MGQVKGPAVAVNKWLKLDWKGTWHVTDAFLREKAVIGMTGDNWFKNMSCWLWQIEEGKSYKN